MANKQKDQDDRDTKVERTLLKVSIEKSEVQTSKLRKSIDLEESLETIRLQRQAEVRVYQERSEAREKEKQEKIDQIGTEFSVVVAKLDKSPRFLQKLDGSDDLSENQLYQWCEQNLRPKRVLVVFPSSTGIC